MSSRVQKGGTLFRPAAKTRGRQSTEPTSSQTADNFSNSFPSTLASSQNEPSTAMPPPLSTSNLPSSAVPLRLSSATPQISLSAGIPGQINPPTRQVPTFSKHTEATMISVPSRRAPIPLVVGQSRQLIAAARVIQPPSAINVDPGPPVAPTAGDSVRVQSHSMDTIQPLAEDSSTHPGCVQGVHHGDLHSDTADPISIPQATNSNSASRPPKRGADPANGQEDGPLEPSVKKPRRSRPKKSVNTDSSSGKATTRRNNAIENGVNDETFDSDAAPKKRRSSTAPSRPRKSKGPSLPPYNLEAPGVDLDPTAVTMANLCKDTGQGRVSSKATEIMNNHVAWKTANREKRARMIAMMEAKKFGRNLEEEEDAANRSNSPGILETEHATTSTLSMAVRPPDVVAPSEGQSHSVNEHSTGEFDYSQTMSSSRFNVQVRIGPNGETVVDEESLFVDTSAEQDTENYTHVEESDTTKFVNSATHSRKYRGYRWTAEETELFFDALAQFGENYELISYVLPGRDRKACKNKFKAEDKKNPSRINHCLKNRIPYDIQTLSRMTGKDFSGPTPVIRAPTPPTMAESDRNASPALDAEDTSVVRKQSQTPGMGQSNDHEELLGDVESFDKDDDT